MSILDAFKRKDKGVPDVGEEDDESDVSENGVDDGPEVEEMEDDEQPMPQQTQKQPSAGSQARDEGAALEIQKINTRLDSINELLKGYTERISTLGQQIGEVRSMALSNEKELGRVSANSSKAIEIVQQVKPENLRVEYQKADSKIQMVNEKLETNKDFMSTVMGQLKEMRRRFQDFLGTEEMIKLNDEIKKDLVQAEQKASQTKLHADKVEQLFAETRRMLSESQKSEERIKNLDANYSDLKKSLERIKIDFSEIVTKKEMDGLKKKFDDKMIMFNKATTKLSDVEKRNAHLGKIIETISGRMEGNKKDIETLSAAVGEDNIYSAKSYGEKIDSILNILDVLATRVSSLEKEVKGSSEGVGGGKIKDMKDESQAQGKSESQGIKDSEVKDYIKKAREQGLDDKDIKEKFKESGWSDEQIDRVMS